MKTRMVVPVVLALAAAASGLDARCLADDPFRETEPARAPSRFRSIFPSLLPAPRPISEADETVAPHPREGRTPGDLGLNPGTYGSVVSMPRVTPIDAGVGSNSFSNSTKPATHTGSRAPVGATLYAPPTAPKSANTEEAAKRVGVTVDELRRLRALGYLDSEVESLVKSGKRVARDMILEREVLNDLSKALDAANAQVFELSGEKKVQERERAIKAALAKAGKDHRAGREDLRKILSGTSYFTPDELKRLLGPPSLFSTDNLRRVGFFGGSDEGRR